MHAFVRVARVAFLGEQQHRDRDRERHEDPRVLAVRTEREASDEARIDHEAPANERSGERGAAEREHHVRKGWYELIEPHHAST